MHVREQTIYLKDNQNLKKRKEKKVNERKKPISCVTIFNKIMTIVVLANYNIWLSSREESQIWVLLSLQWGTELNIGATYWKSEPLKIKPCPNQSAVRKFYSNRSWSDCWLGYSIGRSHCEVSHPSQEAWVRHLEDPDFNSPYHIIWTFTIQLIMTWWMAFNAAISTIHAYHDIVAHQTTTTNFIT